MPFTQRTLRVVLAALATIGLTGCVVNIGDRGPVRAQVVPPPPVPMVCNAAKAQSFVGQNATQATGTAIVQASGARSLRWGPPGAAWTRDYREDRVNVSYDASMKITGITCG